ncbi:hypothetical protein [Dyella tabacisoli]|nr:hypothetical protein [Dyella tabacisoli]
MNNYLGQLIARSRGDLPLLQPRLPGRFEPVNGHDQPDSGPHSEPAAPVTALSAPAPTPTPARASVSTANATVSPPVSETLRRFMPDRHSTDIVTPPSAKDTHSTGTPATSTPQASEPPRPITGQRSVAAQVSPAATTIVQAPSPRGASRIHVDHLDGEQVRPMRHRLDQTPPAIVDTASEETPSPPSAHRATSMLVSPQVHTPPARTSADHASSRIPAVNEHHETVVHVTIGRVDVRAIAAPAPKPSVRQESPRRSSLDDYLSGTPRR